MSADIRTVFLAACAAARPLLASGIVRDRWDEPSALARMTVGALAGHLMRSVTSVDSYLDRDTPSSGQPLDAAGYLLSIDGVSDPDLDSDLHTAVRARAAVEAEAGYGGVLAAWDGALDRLAHRLAAEPDDRLLAVLGGRILTLDEYLVTRLVELVVHTDDLAASLDRECPPFHPDAVSGAVDCLVEVAARRHGRMAVLRALTRRERDPADALRVL